MESVPGAPLNFDQQDRMGQRYPLLPSALLQVASSGLLMHLSLLLLAQQSQLSQASRHPPSNPPAMHIDAQITVPQETVSAASSAKKKNEKKQTYVCVYVCIGVCGHGHMIILSYPLT